MVGVGSTLRLVPQHPGIHAFGSPGGSRRFDPRPRFVEADEARPLLVEWVRHHPIAARFAFFVMGRPLPNEEDEVARTSRDMPVVAFRPK